MRDHIEKMTFLWPLREDVATPPGVRDVWIDGQGPRLHGWFMPGSPIVLHVHGNAGHVGHHAGTSTFLWRAGFGVMVFDYRAFGRSEGRRGARRALLNDAHRALDAALAFDERVGVLGVSLGGVIGLALAAERLEVRCIASVAVFSTWKGVARDHAGALGALMTKPGLDASDSVRRLGDRPLLLVHGVHDRTVPVRHAGILERAAIEAGVSCERIDVDADHNDAIEPVEGPVEAFYRRCLG